MYQALNKVVTSTPTDVTFEDILQTAQLTLEEYEAALAIANKRVNLIMKRSPCEAYINNYNPVILKCLR
jgi:hypothetical protein